MVFPLTRAVRRCILIGGMAAAPHELSPEYAGPLGTHASGRCCHTTQLARHLFWEHTMPYKDPEVRRRKARERARLYKRRMKARLGLPDQGKHGNNPKGTAHPRWNSGRLITSHGYVLVRVPKGHPHGFGNSNRFDYCYEHISVMTAHLGRPLHPGEVVHHRNGDKLDNRLENLSVRTSSDHMSEHMKAHATARNRTPTGQFAPEDEAPEDLKGGRLPWSAPKEN